MLPVVSFRASRLGGESPRKLSGSRSIGLRLAQSPKSARAKTRRRRCATPNHCASRVLHSSRPSSPNAAPSVPQPFLGTSTCRHPAICSTTTAKSRPWLLLNAPGTFSQRAKRQPQCSRAHRTIRVAVVNSPLRSPSNPSRLPATDKSWQGDPNTTKSILPSAAISSDVIFVTSPKFGTAG